MRRKTLTKDCGTCDDCKMDDTNRMYCDWGNSKVIKVLEPPKGKGGYPECNLIKGN